MSAAAVLISRLANRDVTLRSDGDKVIIYGPDELVTHALVREIRAAKSEILAELAKRDAANLSYHYDGRAPIHEFDGGLDCPRAVAQTYESVVAHRENNNPEASSARDGCVHCGRPETPEANVVPFGIGPHVWLHHACWAAWSAARRAEATTALAAIGIPTLSDEEKNIKNPM
jgi:hypothetical protein